VQKAQCDVKPHERKQHFFWHQQQPPVLMKLTAAIAKIFELKERSIEDDVSSTDKVQFVWGGKRKHSYAPV
jgi:hypothetical protein